MNKIYLENIFQKPDNKGTQRQNYVMITRTHQENFI